MKKIIKLGLLSTLLSATLLAEVKVDTTNVKHVSKTKVAVSLSLSDSETLRAPTNVEIEKLSVDNGAKIKGVKLRTYEYSSHVTFNIEGNDCNQSDNTEVSGVFSTTISGRKIELPYSRCIEVPGVVETEYPYKNNTNQEMVLRGSYGYAVDSGRFGYYIRIHGETEKNYDFITLTDQSGRVLTGEVMNPDNFEFTTKELKFSGNFSKKNTRDTVNPFFKEDAIYIFLTGTQVGSGLKVLFTSDGSVTKQGARIDMTQTFPM